MNTSTSVVTILDLIRANEEEPDYPALHDARAWTRNELHKGARRFGARIRTHLPDGNDRVLIHAENSASTWMAILGTWMERAVVVPTMPSLTEEDLAFIIADCCPSVAVVDDASRAKVTKAALTAGVPLAILTTESDDDATSGSHREPQPKASDLAALVYTSGSTGRPKGVMLSHGNFAAQAAGSVSLYAPGGVPSDMTTMYIALPLSHIFGLYLLVTSLLLRNVVVLRPRFNADDAIRDIVEHAASIVPAVPTMLMRFLNSPLAGDLFGRVRHWDVGGSPLPHELAEQVEQRLGGQVLEGWGMSELTGTGINQFAHLPVKRGSVGVPMPQTEIRVVNDRLEDCPPGDAGELLVRGPTVTSGYWNRPEATSKAFVDGWFCTGDIGYMDEDGHYYIYDRKDDLIIRGGENIYPKEVESVLLRHPLVREAAVVGERDTHFGQRVVAFVVPRTAQQPLVSELLSHCESLLPRFKVPARLEVVNELPLNSTGKLQKAVLRQQSIT